MSEVGHTGNGSESDGAWPQLPQGSGSGSRPALPGFAWAAVGALVAVGLLVAGLLMSGTSNETPNVGGQVLATAPGETAAEPDVIDPDLAAQLTYLVEEEKLAHDVYVLADSLYGARIFGNIAASETQHQESVRDLLSAYGIPDPSIDAPAGVFTDPALQSLYDDLAIRVEASRAEAIEAGILIEQTDIADLRTALAEPIPADVGNVLTRLEAASQNHLRAFIRNSARG